MTGHPAATVLLSCLAAMPLSGQPPEQLNRALDEACLDGNVQSIAALVAGGADPQRCLARGLHDGRVLRVLLDAGLDPTLSLGQQALLIAVAGQGNPDGVKALLDHGIDPNLRDGNGWTALMWATGKGRGGLRCIGPDPGHFAETMRVLRAAGAKDDGLDDVELVDAIIGGNTAAALRWLAAGSASPHARDQQGKPAISYAADQANVPLLRALLAAGADPNTSAGGIPPIVGPAGGGTITAPAGPKERVLAASLLLLAGADPNASSRDGTALMFAAAVRPENPELVELLLRKGADVQATSAYGFNALMRAAAAGHLRTSAIFLRKGVPVNARANNGYTALMLAASGQQPAMIRLLLDAGADPTVKASDGRTALTIAREFGDEESISILSKDPTT